MYQSVYKMWAPQEFRDKWTHDLEIFVAARKPSNHQELEEAIHDYEALKNTKRTNHTH